MIIFSQTLVAVGFIMALASVGCTIMKGGITANPAHHDWKRYKEWDWYFWMGWVSVVLWMIGMVIIPFVK